MIPPSHFWVYMQKNWNKLSFEVVSTLLPDLSTGQKLRPFPIIPTAPGPGYFAGMRKKHMLRGLTALDALRGLNFSPGLGRFHLTKSLCYHLLGIWGKGFTVTQGNVPVSGHLRINVNLHSNNNSRDFIKWLLYVRHCTRYFQNMMP